MTYSTLTAALGAAVLALAAVPFPAPAQDVSTQSQVVRFADLNINSPEGAKALYARIKSAAQRVCDNEGISDLTGYHEWRACTREATDTAVAKLNAPMVTALNEGHASGPVILAKAR